MVRAHDEFDWDAYFEREDKSLFQRLISLHRRMFISRAVRYYARRHFPPRGVFLEAGAGTSQSSSRIVPGDRTLIALDYNYPVLAQHNCLPYRVQGDIRRLPFRTASLDGIWNLGVMEHFEDADIRLIMKEFFRVCKPDAVLVLFWPPFFAPFQIILGSISAVMRTIFKKEIEFFPNEVNLYDSRARIQGFFTEAGFVLESVRFNFRDLFSYMVLVARKAAPAAASEVTV